MITVLCVYIIEARVALVRMVNVVFAASRLVRQRGSSLKIDRTSRLFINKEIMEK